MHFMHVSSDSMHKHVRPSVHVFHVHWTKKTLTKTGRLYSQSYSHFIRLSLTVFTLSLVVSLSFSLSLALLQRVINLINFNMLQQQQFNKCASHTLGQSYRKHAALRINGWRRAKRQQLSNLRKKRLVSLNYFRYAQIRSNMLR